MWRRHHQIEYDKIKDAQKESLMKITEIQVVKGLTVDLGGDEEID